MTSKFCNETTDGKTETIKDKVEIDDENRSVTFSAIEGDLFKSYKSYKATVKIITTAEGASAKVKLDYEKLN